jgi:hypothetical protein
MPKLNQIIAVANSRKSEAQGNITQVYKMLQKEVLLEGISRTYQPKDEDGEVFPPENKRVQITVRDALTDVKAIMANLIDLVATQDVGNCEAKGDVIVGDVTILSQVPVTHLLYLEKQMEHLCTVTKKLPVLSTESKWSYDENAGCYATDTVRTGKTKKVPRPIVKYDATKEHPAQTEMFNEDITIGYWDQVKYSGAIPETERRELLERVISVRDAVKQAREAANSSEAKQQNFGTQLVEYIFSK